MEQVVPLAVEASVQLACRPRVLGGSSIPACPVETVDDDAGSSGAIGDRRYPRRRELDLPAPSAQSGRELRNVLRNTAVGRLEG